MNTRKASKTFQEICPQCGKHILSCTCPKTADTTLWPNANSVARSEAEMSARFSILKEEGTGTVFVTGNTDPRPTGITSIDLAPGAIIGGVYQIIELLGFGAMGEVYLAKHLTLDKNCALKVIPPDQVTEVGWQRFQLEAKTVARLQHVNLVRVTDLGIHDDCLPFYAMDYLQGRNLAEVISDDGPLSLAKMLEIFIQVCAGVECAHEKGILHRDLKPANIMLLENPSGKVTVKILDFGLAKLVKHDRSKQSLTSVGDVFGSPAYMSPEQCGGEELDTRSDIYSIGCTLFESLTGRTPFASHIPSAVFFGHLTSTPPTLEHASNGAIFSREMEAIVAKLLQKDPASRYQTMTELKKDLEIVARENITAPQVVSRKQAKKARANQDPSIEQQLVKLPVQKSKPKLRLLVGLWMLVLAAVSSLFLIKDYASKKAVGRAEPGASGLVTTSTAATANGAKSAAVIPAGNALATTAGVAASASPKAATATTQENKILPGELYDNWDGTPFYKGIENVHGRPMQHWVYKTTGQPLIFLGVDAIRGHKALIGDLYLPAETKVSVYLRPEPVFPTSRLKAFNNANIDEINFGRYSYKDVEALAPTFYKIKSITSVRLGDADWTIDESRKAPDIINQFANLQRLSFVAECEASTLARIARFKQLQELKLNRTKLHLPECLKLISGCENLLSFSAFNWSAPSSDLELLVPCTNLQKLTIGRLTGSHEQFLTLAKLPHLQVLEMPSLRYRSDLASDVRLLKSLKTIKLANGPEWNQQLQHFRQELPHVLVDPTAMVGSSRTARKGNQTGVAAGPAGGAAGRSTAAVGQETGAAASTNGVNGQNTGAAAPGLPAQTNPPTKTPEPQGVD